MQNQLLKQPSIPNQLILVFGLGLLLGITSIWLPPYFLLIGVAGIVYLVVAWLWPEFAILGILLFTSTIFDIYAYRSIPIGIGNLIISDILLFALLGIIFLHVMLKSSSYLIHTPVDLPLLAFYSTSILATAIGIFNSSVTFNQSLAEVRTINFYLIFFIVTNLIRTEKQLRRLLGGIFVLATLVAMAMIAQYILGDSVSILPGRVETLNTAGVNSYGITRILPPGQALVLVAFISLTVLMIQNRTSPLYIVSLIQLGIIGLSVILTFNRSFWIASFLALFIVGFLVSIRDKVKYFQTAFWAVLIGAIIFAPILILNGKQAGKLMSGMSIRFSTLFNPDTAQEDSLVYRYVENEYVYSQIVSHPLFGLGLGANYRPWDSRIDYGSFTTRLTYYIHNGHLWVMVKTGLIGYLFFMWFFLLFLKRALQNWKQISDPFLKGIVLSFAAGIVGVLVASIVNPIIRASYWAPVIGIMLSIGEIILRMNNNQTVDSQVLEEWK